MFNRAIYFRRQNASQSDPIKGHVFCSMYKFGRLHGRIELWAPGLTSGTKTHDANKQPPGGQVKALTTSKTVAVLFHLVCLCKGRSGLRPECELCS